MSELLDEKHCSGCYDDHYNREGNSISGRCWMRDKAQMVTRIEVPIDMRPPYSKLPKVKRPDCYKKQRFVLVSPERIGRDGYWAS